MKCHNHWQLIHFKHSIAIYTIIVIGIFIFIYIFFILSKRNVFIDALHTLLNTLITIILSPGDDFSKAYSNFAKLILLIFQELERYRQTAERRHQFQNYTDDI
jgi:hypothetical protein